MPTKQLALRTPDRLRAELQTLPGVYAVVVPPSSDQVFVVCEAPQDALPLEAAAQLALARAGYAPDEIRLEISFRVPQQAPRRVRFEEARLERPRAGVAVATVGLEWADTRHEAVVEGESGPASELRVCALASIAALTEVLAGQVTLQLVGIKSVRVFDSDLVTVVLRCPQIPDRTLIGTALVTVDAARAAALAVLNACNRLVGNYLNTSD